ncbi:hypothetical protein FJ940_07570 [Mesorhizobium sp. B2-3-7]|nr:hypothetical protein FJ939_08575 [Mesorhizobium sp. B2-3-8]TPM18112.1 hypothetical protein FJ940_07570 [Mesorhizobium sp. B2-3-7]
MRCLVITMAMSAFATGAALAASPYVGTWSSDRLNCHAAADIQRQTVYSVDRAALSLPEFGCEHASFRKSPTGWVVHASRCYGSYPSLEEPFTRVIHIERHGATMRFTWPGFDSGLLVHC